MADEATLRIVVQDASVGQSPPPDDAPPLVPYQSAPPPSFSQQQPPANAYQSQPPVPTPRAAARQPSSTDDPYEQARRLRESQIQREQVKAAYDQMYGTAEKANSIFDGVLDAAQKMRGTLGGVFGPLVGALLDIYSATREAKREDGNAIRAEAERRNLLKPEMVFQRQADVAIQQKRQEESTPTSVGPIQSDAVMAESREALLALGNSQIEADKLLRQVMDNANATFATVQDVIRAAYQNKGSSNASATQPQSASTPMPASTTPVPTPPPIRRASGGEVPIVGGIPASADEVPIKATAGEFIVRKDEAQKPANKSMLQAMNSGADVASHFATGGYVVPQIDPFEKHFDVLKSEAMGFPGERKWKHVPHDAELFASGAEAQVFRQPNADEVYRVQSNSGYSEPIDYRPNIEPLLQPTAQKKLEENGRTSLIERMPFAPNFPQVMATMPEPMRFEDTPSQIWEGVVADIKQRLDDSGYEYRDLNPRNVGFRDGKWYIVDPGGLKKKASDDRHFDQGGEIEKPSLFSKAKSVASSVMTAPAKAKDWMTDRYGAGSSAAALAFGNAATWAATPLALSTIGMPLPPGTGIATGILAAELRHQFKSKETIQKEKERDAQIKAAQDKMMADDSAKIGRLPKFDDSGASHFDRGGEVEEGNPRVGKAKSMESFLRSHFPSYQGNKDSGLVEFDNREVYFNREEDDLGRQIIRADFAFSESSGESDDFTAQLKNPRKDSFAFAKRMKQFAQAVKAAGFGLRAEGSTGSRDEAYHKILTSKSVGMKPSESDPSIYFRRGGEIQSRNRLPHFASGGVIPPSPNVSPHSDNVPIAATAGEYVVRRDAASRPENRQVLDNMNRGAAPTPQAQPDMIDLIMKSIVNPMIGVREMEPWSLESTQLRVLASVDAMRANRESPTPSNPNMPSVPNTAPASDNPISIVPSANVVPSSANAIPVARTATAGIARGPLPVAATATTVNAAGMAGMAAKAVPVLGTVVVVAEALTKVFGALNSAVNETVTKYADLNPAVAQAQARAEMTAIFGDMRRANEAAPQLTRYIEVQSRLQQQYEEVKIQILKKFIDTVEPVMDLLDKVLPLLPNMLRVLDAAFPLIGLIAEAAAFIASFLPQQNQPTFEDPVEIILNRPEQIQMPPNVGG